MKLSVFLSIKAVIAFAFGIVLVAIPTSFISLFAYLQCPVGILNTRIAGALLIGIAFICWSVRSCSDTKTVKGILLGLFIADTIGFIVVLLAQLSDVMNALGWVDVGIWFLLASGLGYFRFLKTSASEA